MSLRTCSCDLPQKLHLSWPFSSPNLNKLPSLFAGLRSARYVCVLRGGRFRGAWFARLAAEDEVADPVCHRFLRRHVVVALHVAFDLVDGLSGCLDVDVGQNP